MRRAAAATAAALALLGALTACGASARHVEDICRDVTTGTAELARYDPSRPTSALQFALGRFDLVEEAVGKAREAGLPDDAAPTLRADWLAPAVTSMASWQTRLQALRTAVDSGSTDAVEAAFGPALALGTDGVDTAALTRVGYPACAAAFTAPSVASTRA